MRVLFWRGEYPSDPGVPYLRLRSSGRAQGWPMAMLRYLKVFRPGLLHLHGPTAGSMGAAVARLAGVPVIVYTEHNPHDSRPPVARLPRRATCRLPDMNVAISREVARSLVEDCGVSRARVRIILNGTPEVAPLSPPSEQPNRFIYVANLLARKGHETLIQAFAMADHAATLSLVGDGPERDGLRALTQRLGLGDRVSFHGWLDDPWSVAEGALAYVHPARIEGGGIAVMEAMMRGLPVIVTATGGLTDIVQHGQTGLIVPVGDVNALAGSIRMLSDDPRGREALAGAARAFALRHLTLDRMLESYRALYRELGT